MARVLAHVFVLLFGFCGLPYNVMCEEDCLVTIRNGTIIGRNAGMSRLVCAYTAIPFAAPPTGLLRFQPPQPAAAWDTLNATSQPNWCPQAGTPPEGVTMSEDCLYLNVYQPRREDGSKLEGLPVMMWIYGGAYILGHSYLYAPGRLLARGDVIVVVAHYRLGLLGFLSTGNEDAPGNWGLKDQAHAIRWVNENIEAFGGNRSQVTLFGQSAGGSSAMYQLLTPLNKGLVHGVIAQSGIPLSSWSLDKTPLESAGMMAKRFGCEDISDSASIVSCLREISWEQIVQEQLALKPEYESKLRYATATMAPVVEPNLPGAFITDHPIKIMEGGDIPQIPVMLGATKHDGSFFLAGMYQNWFRPQQLDTNPVYMKTKVVADLLKFFGVEGDDGNEGAAASTAMTFFPDVDRTSWNDSMPGLVDLITSFAFKSSTERAAQLLSQRNMSVYLYSFEHHSLNSMYEYLIGGILAPVSGGIAHSDDILYLFDIPVEFGEADKRFSELFSDLWINFGKFGNPTPNTDLDFQWPTYDIFQEAFVKINATPTVKYRYRSSWRPNGFEWN